MRVAPPSDSMLPMNSVTQRHTLLVLSILLSVSPSVSWSAQDPPLAAPAIARMVRLPAGGLQAVETTDGELLFLSDTGRYAFRGPAADLWHGAKLTDLDTLQRLAGRIDLSRLKLDAGELGAIDIGAGPDVIVFVDPYCLHSKAVLQDLDGLVSRYRFRLVPLPVLREASQQAVLALDCLAATAPDAARQALMGKTAMAQLPKPTGDRGQAPAQRALITAQILGIQGTPFLIAPDGRMRQGRPDTLGDWLDGRSL